MAITAAWLKSVEVLRAFPESMLAELASQGAERRFEPGQGILEAGQQVETVSYVVEGLVGLYMPREEGTPALFSILGPGKLVGFGGFLGGKALVHGRALMSTTVFCFSVGQIQALLAKDSEIPSRVHEELLEIQDSRTRAMTRALVAEEVSFPTEQPCPVGRPTRFLAIAKTRTGHIRGMCLRRFLCSVAQGKGCPMAGKPAHQLYQIWPPFSAKEIVGAQAGDGDQSA